jgi:glycyl-tRNA synthetase beta subunit
MESIMSEAEAKVTDSECEAERKRFLAETEAIGISRVLRMADQIDHLVGFFGLGKFPTGSKDPHQLRRAAYAVVECFESLCLDISESFLLDDKGKGGDSAQKLHIIVSNAIELYAKQGRHFPKENTDKVIPYIEGRRKSLMKERGKNENS